MATILEKWQISAEELTKIVDENPSLRGFMFGYVSEYKGKFQCDASDRREILLPNGHTVDTTCLAVGEFDIVAVSLYAFGDEWKFAFAKNSDLPHPGARSRNVAEADREYLIKTLIDITWPLQPPFTTDVYALLDSML